MLASVTDFFVEDDRLPDGDYYVRFVTSGFVDGEGLDRPPGSVQEFEATASNGLLTAPDVEVATTTDARVNQRSFYSVKVCKTNASRTVVLDLADGIVVPWAVLPSYTWAELKLFGAAQMPFRDSAVYTKAETIREIDVRVNAIGFPNARTNVAGKGYASRNPLSGAPTFVTTDDPLFRDATKIQNVPVSPAAPSSVGQALVWDGSMYRPGTPSELVRPYVLRDEFNETDGTPNTGRRPSYVDNVGTFWRNGSGDWTIEDGKARPSSPFADGDNQWLDAGTSDFTLTCRVSSDAGSDAASSSSAGLVFRREDENNFWVVNVDSRAGLTVLYEKTNGVFSPARATINAAPASGVEIPLTVITSGSQITVYLFGQTPVHYTSSAHENATKVGMRAGHGGGTPSGVPTFSEFTVTPTLQKAAAPIITRGAPGEWDCDAVAATSRPVLDEANNRYAMAYSGFSNATGLWQTGFVYCPVGADLLDPANWTKEPTNPKLTPTARQGYIAGSAGLVKVDGAFQMVVQGAQNAVAGNPALPWEIFGASSPDMTDGGDWDWLNGGEPILPLGAPGSFDESHHDADVRYRSDGMLEIVLAARNGAGQFTLGISVGASLEDMGPTEQLPLLDADGNHITGLLNPSIGGDDPVNFSLYFCYDVSSARQILRADTDDGGSSFKWLNGVLLKSPSGFDSVQAFDPVAPFEIEGVGYVTYTGAAVTGGTEGAFDVGIASFTVPTAAPDPLPDDPAPEFVTLADGATITLDFSNGPIVNAQVTLGGNRTLAVSGATSGDEFHLYVTQDATGSRTLSLPAGWKVAGGGSGAVALTATANAVDLVRGRLVGSVWRVERVLNFT